MSRLRFGLIGAGDIARKRVAPALRDSALCEFVAVARADASRAAAFAAEFGAARSYADWHDLIADPDVQAVYVATPVHLHAAGVDDAMAAAVDTGAMGTTGAKLAPLTRDPVDPGHWSTELAAVSAPDIANFVASRWYVNLATPAQPAGAIRGQIDAPPH